LEQLFDLIRTIVVTDGGPLDLDGEKNGEISYKFNFSENCFHEPEIWAMDYVGNVYLYKEKFLVDCTPPGIEKRIPKVVALGQTEDGKFVDTKVAEPYSCWGSWIDNNQSFIAPWSYIDAISVKLVGSGSIYCSTNDTWVELYDENGLVASSEVIPIDGSIDGWLQFHFPERVYTEHNKTYWLTVKSYADIAWYYNESDPYDGGNATVNGVTNDSWDFTFKIEYYPIVLDNTDPTAIYPMEYTLFNETVSRDGLDKTYVTSQAFFNLSSWDEGCMGGVGLASLQYRVWWNGSWSEWMNYTQPFNLPDECKHYIEIKAVDLLGNTRIINQTHYVDNSPPELNLTDMPDNECAVGWHNFTFYWRYEYTNFTTPYIEEHPANDSDTEYPGELVYINGNWWWKVDVTGEPSIALSFDRECMHTIYYFYNATDWLDNEVNSDIQEEVIYVDENGPELEKEHPPCYTDEPWIYLHPAPLQKMPDPWDVPDINDWVTYTYWDELYPDFGREYYGVDTNGDPHFTSTGFIDNGNDIVDYCDYIELYDVNYDVYRLYHVENLTVTMEIYNETLNETKYVEFTAILTILHGLLNHCIMVLL